MKKNTTIKPTRSKFNILRQICNLIPKHEVSKNARQTGVEDKSRTFSPSSHTVSLLDAQLTPFIGLNDLWEMPEAKTSLEVCVRPQGVVY
jgi:hypothetical protein